MTTPRRIRIEYDFSVTSRSTSVVDRIDTKTRNLNTNITRTTNSIKNFSGALNGIHAPARRAESSLNGFSRAVSNVSRSVGYAFRNMFSWRTLFIGFATGNLIGAAKRALIDYNVEMDNFRQGISMSLNQMTDWEKSFGGVSSAQERWNKSMIGSQAIMNNLRKYAAQSIGSVKEYAEAFQLINSQIMAIGGTAGNSIEVAKRLVPLTKASGRDIMTGAMDINQILRGDPNLRQINLPALRDPRVLELSKLARGNPKKGIAGDPKLALEKLLEILKESDVGVRAYAKTYQAQLETMTDNLQVFAARVGEPIFNRITKEMTIFNKDWASTEAGLKRTGEKFGKFLVEAFDKGKEGLAAFITGVKQLGGAVITLTQAMIGLRIAGMAAGVASMATSAAGTNKLAFPKLATAASYAGSSFAFMRGKNIGDLPPINTNAAGAGRIGSPGGSSIIGAPASGIASGIQGGRVSAARGIFGSAVLGALGLGIALTVLSDRTKELAKQEGYLGQMAKNTGDVVKGVASIFTFLGDVSIALVGSIAGAAKAMGQFSAKLFGFQQPRSVRSFDKTALGDVSKSVEPITSLAQTQQDEAKALEQRLISLYGNDMYARTIINKAMSGLREPTGPTEAEQFIAAGQYEEAFRSISRAIITGSTAGRRKSKVTAIAGKSTLLDKATGTDRTNIIESLPLNDQMIAAAIAGGQITSDQAKQMTDEMAQLMIKSNEQRDRKMMEAEQMMADSFKGRQKAENKFDFSNSTININQDFRNEDPDRVYIKFAQDIGLVSATMIQSRLSPVVR